MRLNRKILVNDSVEGAGIKMCSVYYLSAETFEEIRDIVSEVDRSLYGEFCAKDIHPMDYAPIITAGRQGKRLTSCRWGYPGLQGKGVIFNARSETVREKRMFQKGIQYHRAVIPASHFYEWNASKEKNTFLREDGKTMFLAGFHDLLNNEERFVILTTVANDSMKKVHDRMPLILEENQLDSWLYDAAKTEIILGQTPGTLERKTDFEQMTLF